MTTKVINSILGDYSFLELVKKMQCNNFSILIDESTDHSSTKNLAIMLRLVENFVINDQFWAK
jgi:hypothetical protein